jgi:uncharacterized protein YjbI with pentapeptide repeats
MANKEHLARLKQGKLTLAGVDLRGADLARVILVGKDLRKANLTGADLHRVACNHADLREADLTGANLARADLQYANLCRADLQGADIQGARLERADLQMANLSGAKLTGASFFGAKMGGTILGNVDLSMVEGLETVAHQGPSTISTDTLYRSNGKIPEVFLREAGVPEDIITHVRTQVGRGYRVLFVLYQLFK